MSLTMVGKIMSLEALHVHKKLIKRTIFFNDLHTRGARGEYKTKFPPNDLPIEVT